MRVAAIQMTSGPDKSANLARAHELILEALDEALDGQSLDLVCLPEMFSILTDDSRQLYHESETLKGPTVQTLQEWAAEYDLWIVGGSVPLRASQGKITNTSLLISPEGEIKARYDKIHLFDARLTGQKPYHESRTTRAGRSPSPIVTIVKPFKAALSVCYDLRFPELYRGYSQRGANLLFIP